MTRVWASSTPLQPHACEISVNSSARFEKHNRLCCENVASNIARRCWCHENRFPNPLLSPERNVIEIKHPLNFVLGRGFPTCGLPTPSQTYKVGFSHWLNEANPFAQRSIMAHLSDGEKFTLTPFENLIDRRQLRPKNNFVSSTLLMR